MKSTGVADLQALWRMVDLRRGQIVLCHSSLPAFGRIEGGPEVVLDTLIATLGPEGTLVVPAFTYSFFKGETYDPEATASTVGILGDLLRRRPGAIRSLDPNFSNVAVGRLAADLTGVLGPASFGANSFYDRLLRLDGLVLLAGVDYTALPLFMHLEWRLKVPYRYEKAFSGSIRVGGETRGLTAVHFVRDERLDPHTDRRRVGTIVDADPSVRRADCAYGTVRALPARTVERVVRREVEKDALILLDAERPFLAGSGP